MSWIEALILGVLQGLAEFLPISSSGHLEIGKHLLDIEANESLAFTVVVHGATVLSTIVVFWKQIITLFQGVFKFKWNTETEYVAKIIVSMIPIAIVGVFFKDSVESLFDGNIVFVGTMLIVTASLLAFTYYAKPKSKGISYMHAFIIGIAQSIAVIPGISRAGATISTGLLLGNKKEEVAKFSFLMVIIPILGANLMDVAGGESLVNVDILPLAVGFLSAFVTGLLACKLMIKIVNKGKLIYFAIYCLLVGLIAIIF